MKFLKQSILPFLLILVTAYILRTAIVLPWNILTNVLFERLLEERNGFTLLVSPLLFPFYVLSSLVLTYVVGKSYTLLFPSKPALPYWGMALVCILFFFLFQVSLYVLVDRYCADPEYFTRNEFCYGWVGIY